VKLDEADVPVTSEEEAYPVKLDEADVPAMLDHRRCWSCAEGELTWLAAR